MTEIPSDAEGVLYDTIEVFEPDGAIIGLTSQSPTALGAAPEVDLSFCSGPIR